MTTIHVKEETWAKLNGLKKAGETMDDVIQNLFNNLKDVQDDQSTLDDLGQKSFNKLLDEFCSIADKEIPKTLLGSRNGFQKELIGEK